MEKKHNKEIEEMKEELTKREQESVQLVSDSIDKKIEARLNEEKSKYSNDINQLADKISTLETEKTESMKKLETVTKSEASFKLSFFLLCFILCCDFLVSLK